MTRETRIRRNRRREMMRRRRRFFCTLIGLVTVFSVVSCIMLAAPSISAQEDCFITVTVEPGDSLWSIVSESCSGNGNIRKIIAEVKKLNDIKGSCISVGDSLIVPVNQAL